LDYLDEYSGTYAVPDDTSPPPQALVPRSQTTSDPSGQPGSIIKEKIPAAPDTDTATKQTIQKMCEYIGAGVPDGMCRAWAYSAVQRFARGSTDPKQMCWALWWFVKHVVKFALDEPRLFEVGEPEALDMLIAPAVLVRDPAPREDCDGFTMLLCCLLKICGIPSVIVTVAADPRDQERWSHVFPMAQVNGEYMPMDCSHGKHPGWMVPRAHIFRWQAWDLAGNKVEAFPPAATNTLHNYTSARRPMLRRGMRGMGQDPTDSGIVDNSPLPWDPFASTPALPVTTTNPLDVWNLPGGGNIDAQNPTTTTAPATTPSNSLASIISAISSGAAKAVQLATLPAGYTMGANGQLVYTGQAAANAQLTSSFASILPWLGIGLVAIIVLPLVMGGRR
jgi:hypothetical protein